MTRSSFLRTVLLVLAVSHPAAAQDNVFFGNLHSHTSFSDGSSTPSIAYPHAKAAGLDFLAITEHNHAQAGQLATNPSLYNGTQQSSVQSQAKKHTKDGKFIALYGQEFSTISSGNHMNVLDVPTVIDVASGRYDLLLNTWLPTHLDTTGQEAILLLNHPSQSDSPNEIEYGRDDFPDIATWIQTLDRKARLINLMNGPSHTEGTGLKPGTPSESEFKRYLSLGLHVAPTADQDNHKENWGDATNARTAVIAPTLTKTSILAALRDRHVYATEDKNLKIITRVNNELFGTIITGASVPAPATNLTITVALTDADEPAANYTIHVFTGKIGDGVLADAVSTTTREGNGNVTINNVAYTGGRQYVYLKIIQRDDDNQEDRAWTAPVWFEPSLAGATPAPPPPAHLTLSVDPVAESARITNTGGQAITITGWTLRSVVGDQRFTFPTTTITPGTTLIVRSGPQAVGTTPGVVNWTTNFIWNNEHDPGELLDPTGTLVAETP